MKILKAWGWRGLVIALEGIALIVTTLLLGSGYLAWRLSQGPVSLDFVAPQVKTVVQNALKDQGLVFTAGSLAIAWNAATNSLRLNLGEVKAEVNSTGGPDRPLVALASMDIDLDIPALIGGRIQPTELTFAKPVVHVLRNADGTIGLDWHTQPTADADQGLETALIKTLGQPFAPQVPFGLLRRVVIRQARLIVDDRWSGIPWETVDADLILSRGDKAVDLTFRTELKLASGIVRVSAAGSYKPEEDLTRVALDIDKITTADLAILAPGLSIPGNIAWPMRGRINADFDAGLNITALTAELNHLEGAGRLLASMAVSTPGELGLVDVWFDDIDLGALSAYEGASVLAPGFHLPLSGWLRVPLSKTGLSGAIHLRATGGPGVIALSRWQASPVAVDSVVVDGQLDLAARQAELTRVDIELDDGTRISAIGTATAALDDVITWKASASLRDRQVDRVSLLWPADLAPEVRQWITTHMSAGMITYAGIDAVGNFDMSRGEALLRELGGSLDAHGVTLEYLEGMPLGHGLSARANYDTNHFAIDVMPGGIIEQTIKVGAARVLFLGLDSDQDARADIRVALSGPVRNMLEIIDRPGFQLVKNMGLDTHAVSGDAKIDLTVRFPLSQDLAPESVDIAATAQVAGASMRDIVPGMNLTTGQLTIVVNRDGISVSGSAYIDGVPVKGSGQQRFSGDQPRQHLDVTALIDEAMHARVGLPGWARIGGVVPVRLRLSSVADGAFDLALSADLGANLVELKSASWRKAAGVPATIMARVGIHNGNVRGAATFSASSAGVRIDGQVDFLPETTVPSAFVLHDLRLGRSTLSLLQATRTGPANWRVLATGDQIDLSMVLSDTAEPDAVQAADASKAVDASSGSGIDIRFEFGRVLLPGSHELASVVGSAVMAGSVWEQAEIAASVGDARVIARLMPKIQPEELYSVGLWRSLRVDTANLGEVLDTFETASRIRGGQLRIEGLIDPATQFSGQLDLTDFQVLRVPALMRLLNAFSLTGIVDLIQNDGVSFSQLQGNLEVGRQGIVFRNARLVGGTLGLTADGRIDPDAGYINAAGTISPFSMFDSIVGVVPLLGQILTGGDGQAILAANWRAEGSLDEPTITVNPFALAAPGFLRQLLFPATDSWHSVPPTTPEPSNGDTAH